MTYGKNVKLLDGTKRARINWDGRKLFVVVGFRGNNLTCGHCGDGGYRFVKGFPLRPGGNLFGVTYGNGHFVTVGDSGTILTSTDGGSWKGHTSGISDRLDGVTYGNGLFVTVGYWGSSGIIFTSPDGITWTERTSGISENLYGVTYSQ